ncbi:DUF1292 domain-containing protein [Mahella sp.]|uniref:DUF1292 domain-containing protein n=1 Tax=Mahella sp. TaxID=2798721 RepID=UPI0025C381CF|nr:DUF1292 domain-containing protein [Mahella sp.]MBZ4666311.1 hypothetical protein [Mahella sp.]MDK2902882.1 hypothetical protein [Clostridiales bacterium]
MVDEENIVTLIDEDNNEVQFEHILTLEIDDKEYVLLSPLEPMEDLDQDEAIVLKIEQDDSGEDIYVSIDDEDEMQAVYDAYMEIISEEEDAEEDLYDDEDEDDDEDDDE